MPIWITAGEQGPAGSRRNCFGGCAVSVWCPSEGRLLTTLEITAPCVKQASVLHHRREGGSPADRIASLGGRRVRMRRLKRLPGQVMQNARSVGPMLLPDPGQPVPKPGSPPSLSHRPGQRMSRRVRGGCRESRWPRRQNRLSSSRPNPCSRPPGAGHPRRLRHSEWGAAPGGQP